MNWLRRKLLWWGIRKLTPAKPKPGNILIIAVGSKFISITEVEGGQLPK